MLYDMATTRAQPGGRTDITILNQGEDKIPTAQLSRALEDYSQEEEEYTQTVYCSSSEEQIQAKLTSITLSCQDLDYFEAREMQPAQTFSPCAIKYPQSSKKSGFHKKRSHPQAPLGKSRHEPRVHRDTDLERIKLEKWHAIKEMWKEYNPEEGCRATEDSSTISSSIIQTMGEPETAWSAFAAAHGAQGGTLGERRLLRLRQTGRYMQDPSRASNRSDGHLPPSLQPAKSRASHRRSQARSSATFIPPTNSSQAQSSPDRRDYGFNKADYRAYDEDNNYGNTEEARTQTF